MSETNDAFAGIAKGLLAESIDDIVKMRIAGDELFVRMFNDAFRTAVSEDGKENDSLVVALLCVANRLDALYLQAGLEKIVGGLE